MNGIDNTPPLEFYPPSSDEASPVLVCAGQAVVTSLTDGVRILEIEPTLELGRGQAKPSQPGRRFETADPHMSRAHALLRRIDPHRVVLHDLGSRNGITVNGIPMTCDQVLDDGSVIFIGAHVFVYRLMPREDLEAITSDMARPFGPVPSVSPVLARLFEKLRRLARSEVDILLSGETGVGKEVVANAIHKESSRSGPFVAINCAALPDTLLESELFGYARGAHSMAEQGKAGLLEQAEGGTLFLDEIGEMSPTAQSKLLRFLQDRLVLPLGSTRPRRLSVRVIAATRRSVAANDQMSGLRFDLAARLGPEPLVIPPLRARLEDVGILSRYFLRDTPWSFDIRGYRGLFLHHWPGNVRELEKTLRMAAVLSEGRQQIDPQYLRFPPASQTLPEVPPRIMEAVAATLAASSGANSAAASHAPPRPTPDLLATMLERHRGNVAEVARELHRQRTLVWRWLRKAGLNPSHFRGPTDPGPPS